MNTTAGGADYLADTSAHVGSWKRIYCLTACAFTTLTSPTMSGTLSGITLVAGQQIEGIFTAITLSSGKVIAYQNI